MKDRKIGNWTLLQLVAKAMCYRGVGDPHARDTKGEPRWKWYLDDANKFIDVFGYEMKDPAVENYREPGEFGEGATVRRAEPTRPIVGIENRTAKEVFYIMCARIRAEVNQMKAEYSGKVADMATRFRAEPVLDKDAEIERLQNENASLRHSSLVTRLSHEQLNRFIQLFDRAGFKGHQVDIQAKMTVEELERLREALRKIAAYDDAAADAYLRATGSYRCFDEPKAVEMARGVLEGKTDG